MLCDGWCVVLIVGCGVCVGVMCVVSPYVFSLGVSRFLVVGCCVLLRVVCC